MSVKLQLTSMWNVIVMIINAQFNCNELKWVEEFIMEFIGEWNFIAIQ